MRLLREQEAMKPPPARPAAADQDGPPYRPLLPCGRLLPMPAEPEGGPRAGAVGP